MSKFSIDRQVPYYEQFYHTIKKMIFEGQFKPGDRINETHLAKEFNVSKSPIREAIRILEKEGLIAVENSKVVVYEPTLKDVEEIYFCRKALESFAVSLTTNIASDAQLEEIEITLEETKKAIAEKKEANYIIKLNNKFHDLIIEFTNNTRLQKQIHDLKGLVYLFRILNFQGENRAETILEQHSRIFDQMKARNPEKASEEMISHLENDTENLRIVLTSNNRM